jgi:hypothetical protein
LALKWRNLKKEKGDVVAEGKKRRDESHRSWLGEDKRNRERGRYGRRSA